MKQGITNKVQVTLDIEDMETVEKIEFKFSQEGVGLIKTYPSDYAVLDDDGETINIEVTAEDTWAFFPGIVELDPRIKLVGTKFNPHTGIVKLNLEPTRFSKDE